jgi:hypothetical protein
MIWNSTPYLVNTWIEAFSGGTGACLIHLKCFKAMSFSKMYLVLWVFISYRVSPLAAAAAAAANLL